MTGLQGATALVTGAAGFIGTHLVRRLAAAGAQVAGLTSAVGQARGTAPGVTFHRADLRDAAAVRAVVHRIRPDLVFHLAAVGVTEFGVDPIEALQVNVAGTLHLLAALENTGYRRLLFASTSHEYGDNPPPFCEDQPLLPPNVYAASKSAAWLFLRMYQHSRGWPIVAVRPFGVYGPGQPLPAFLPALILSALRGQDFDMTAGEQVRDFIYVADVIEGMLRAAVTPAIEGQVFNLCSGSGVSLAQVAGQVMALMGQPIRVRLGALPYRSDTIWRMVGDNTRARQSLGWRPSVSLDEGLRQTIDWCTQHLYKSMP